MGIERGTPKSLAKHTTHHEFYAKSHELPQLEKEIGRAKQELDEIKRELDAARQELISKQQYLSNDLAAWKKRAIADAQKEIQDIRHSQFEEIKPELNSLMTSRNKLRREVELYTDRRNDLRAEAKKIEDMTLRTPTNDPKISVLQERVKTLTGQVERLNTENHDLKRELDAIRPQKTDSNDHLSTLFRRD
ncbi:Chromosome partition protein Smc [Vibrio cholerae]|nr:Chromosome partition protein Smc [Vibrio cholerae]